MNTFFSSFGKIALIALLFIALMGAGYYLGISGKVSILPNNPKPTAAQTVNPNALVTDTPTPQLEADQPLAGSPTPTPAPTTTRTISAGLAASSGLAFGQYSLQVPDGWNVNHEFDNGIPMDTLTLTKAGAQMKIYQAATGGGVCLFPGDTPFEGPSSNYTSFVQITGLAGKIFRRGTTAGGSGTQGFTVCERNSEGSYGAPTSFGHMSITAPLDAPSAILQEVDSMIASLKKT